MNEMFKSRYEAMPYAVKMRTEANLESLIKSAEASRLFLDKTIVDNMMCEAMELLKYIHDDRLNKRMRIKKVLENMDTERIVEIWNRYIDASNHFDDEVYTMDDFDNQMESRSILDVITDCFHGEFKPSDYYWYYTENGDISSFDFWDESSSPIDLDDVAAFAVEHENDMDVVTIRNILNGKNEEEE